jgi:cysteinyl-tRNA synthetase
MIALAYMSIGEAEEYRFYWQPEWAYAPPAWLGPENPDWQGRCEIVAAFFDPAGPITGRGDAFMEAAAGFAIAE